MPENNAPARTTNLIAAGVGVIALAAVFLAGSVVADDDGPSGGPAPAAASTTETFGVVTSGQGKASGTPDQLRFTATVSNTRATTELAMTATNHDVRAVTIRARNAGVAARDVQTADLSIQARYDDNGGERRVVGYTSTQRIKILVRKLDKAGETIGGVTSGAGNAVTIDGITLSLSNSDELVARARAQAVKRSKAAAEALAEAAGRDVGELEYVEEVRPQQYGYDVTDGVLASRSLAESLTSLDQAASVPISPGQQKFDVSVNVRWSLD